MTDSESTDRVQEPEDISEQEKIAWLGGIQVPGHPGFTFRGAPTKNGDVFDIHVVQDSTNISIGSARGRTVAEVVEHARELAEEFTAD
jgi:hypothetical protein